MRAPEEALGARGAASQAAAGHREYPKHAWKPSEGFGVRVTRWDTYTDYHTKCSRHKKRGVISVAGEQESFKS